ncbi:hypothetical protein [Rummeliibacillus pycnus]|nr:hypothetical protein [Rummeliibacillus pycnus]
MLFTYVSFSIMIGFGEKKLNYKAFSLVYLEGEPNNGKQQLA